MAVSRIKTYVRGFDDALAGGLPEGYITLIAGAPGTMKSSLCFSVLYNNALVEGRKSAYFTLEEGKDILLEHMQGLGFTEEKAFKNLSVLDMGTIRKNLNFLQARGTWIELFKMYASSTPWTAWRRWRSSRTGGRNCTTCSSGCGTWGRRLS